MNAQKELKSVSLRNSFLSTLSNILYVIGVIAILAGVINFFIGIDYADSFIDEKRYLANSYKTIGIGSAFSGFCLFFFGAIGKAINEIRNYIIADFNLRNEHTVESAKATQVDRTSQSVGATPSKTDTQEVKEEKELTTFDDLSVGDTVKHLASGKLFKIIGVPGYGFIQCEPTNKDLLAKIFDSYTSFKRNEIEKVEM